MAPPPVTSRLSRTHSASFVFLGALGGLVSGVIHWCLLRLMGLLLVVGHLMGRENRILASVLFLGLSVVGGVVFAFLTHGRPMRPEATVVAAVAFATIWWSMSWWVLMDVSDEGVALGPGHVLALALGVANFGLVLGGMAAYEGKIRTWVSGFGRSPSRRVRGSPGSTAVPPAGSCADGSAPPASPRLRNRRPQRQLVACHVLLDQQSWLQYGHGRSRLSRGQPVGIPYSVGPYVPLPGGEDGTRTRNPRLAKAVRYQLRHFPVRNLHHQIDRSRSAPRKVPAGRIDNT